MSRPVNLWRGNVLITRLSACACSFARAMLFNSYSPRLRFPWKWCVCVRVSLRKIRVHCDKKFVRNAGASCINTSHWHSPYISFAILILSLQTKEILPIVPEHNTFGARPDTPVLYTYNPPTAVRVNCEYICSDPNQICFLRLSWRRDYETSSCIFIHRLIINFLPTLTWNNCPAKSLQGATNNPEGYNEVFAGLSYVKVQILAGL